MIRRRKTKLTTRDIERANIGEKYVGVSIDEIPDDLDYRGYLERYMDGLQHRFSDGIGLLLHGEHDRGKTAAGVVVLKRTLGLGGTGLFLEAERIPVLTIEKRRFDTDMSWMERAETVDLLVLDDLGAEHKHEWGASLIEGLLRIRHNRNRPTIVTTNIPQEDLAPRYGGGVLGVFKESYVPVLVEGKDWRAEKATALERMFAPRVKRTA